MEPQDSGPNVLNAHAVSTKSESRDSQRQSLMVINVCVNGFAEPLRALIDSGASNNFVREQVVKSHGINVPDSVTGTVVRLANGATVQMAKRVIRLKMRYDEFRGEDEFILLDLDEKFDLILGMPWLKRYQPRIDWSKMSISLDSTTSAEASTVSTDIVTWAFTSVEDIPDGPCEIAVSDGPPRS